MNSSHLLQEAAKDLGELCRQILGIFPSSWGKKNPTHTSATYLTQVESGWNHSTYTKIHAIYESIYWFILNLYDNNYCYRSGKVVRTFFTDFGYYLFTKKGCLTKKKWTETSTKKDGHIRWLHHKYESANICQNQYSKCYRFAARWCKT